jgi:hypothetical protein
MHNAAKETSTVHFQLLQQAVPGQREELPTGVTVLGRPILSPMPLERKRQYRDIALSQAAQFFLIFGD